MKEIELLEKPNIYSVSRLKCLSTCSQYYKLKYIDRIKATSVSASTILGSLCHDALEAYHNPEETPTGLLLDYFKQTSYGTLIQRKVLPESLGDLSSDLFSRLVDYSNDCHSLYARASKDYSGPNPIRKKDGSFAANPTSTSDWKKAEATLKLPSRKVSIDTEVWRLNPELEGISISEVYSEAQFICSKYRTPKEVVKTLHVEFPISTYDADTGFLKNPVLMPPEFGGDDSIYLNGFVDWIGIVNKGKGDKLAIVDYKSSKENMQADQVIYNVQLYSYVYAYELLYDVKVDLIGIHNLRFNDLVLVELDREIMASVLESLFFKHKIIKSQLFYKHIPDTAYSPCLSQFGRQCEFLKHCYPNLYRKLEGDNSLDADMADLAKELNIGFSL